MTLVRTGDIVARAAAHGSAVAAFNVITLEHAEAIVAGAVEVDIPVVLQISENAVRYHGDAVLPIAVASAAVAQAASVPVGLHLDHTTNLDQVEAAASVGFSSVMFDAGDLPYRNNLALTVDAVRLAHESGVWLEAELGYVGGKPGAPLGAHDPAVRTDPDEAVAFVAATGVDALAVAVGSKHAMTDRTVRLDIDRIAALHDAVNVPLVLHGSSGVPDDELRRAVAAGIAKVNVGTALNSAMTGAVRAALAADRDVVDPRRYLADGRTAMTQIVRHLLGVISG